MIRWEYHGQFGSNGPPLIFVGIALLIISSIFVDLLGAYAYPSHRLAADGLPATGTILHKMWGPPSHRWRHWPAQHSPSKDSS